MTSIAMQLLKRAYDAHQSGGSLVTTSNIDVSNTDVLELALDFLQNECYINIEKRYIHGASYSITNRGIEYIKA